MAITKDEFKRRVKGDSTSPSMLTDLDVSVIDSVFRDYDASDRTNVSENDAFAEIIYKIVELFEASIYPDSSMAGTIINDVVAALSHPRRLAGKGGDARRELDEAKTRLDGIITKLGDLKTKYNDEAFIRDLVSDIATITNKEVRKSLWERILTESNKEVFSVADDKAQARVAGEELWSRLNTEMASARIGDDLTSIVRDSDYLDSIETAWTNVQNGDTGAYRELNETIAQLESDLGGFVTDALLDNDDDRIKANYQGSSGILLDKLSESIDDFLEIASKDEMDELNKELEEALGRPDPSTAFASIVGDADVKDRIEEAIRKLGTKMADPAVRTTGVSVTDIENLINEPSTGFQKVFDDAVAAYEAADLEVKKAEFKNANFSVGIVILEERLAHATGWEKDLLQEEVDYRRDAATNSLAKLPTTNLERILQRYSATCGLTTPFNVADERINRDWLNDCICDKNLAELYTNVSGADQLNADFKNAINARFGASAGKVIALVEEEVFGRHTACSPPPSGRNEWYAKYSNIKLREILVNNRQPNDVDNPFPGNPLTSDEIDNINRTIRVREAKRSEWFVAANNLLSDSDLDTVEFLQTELERRNIDLDPLKATRSTKESERDTAEANLKAAKLKIKSRGRFNQLCTNKAAKVSGLTANQTKRPKIAELKAAKDIKAVYDVLLAAAVSHFSTQQNFDDTAIRNYLTSHTRISELRGSTYPKKCELEDQLVSEISRRLNKTRSAAPVVNHGSAPKKWYQVVVDWVEKTAGAALGAAATCLTNSPVILIGGAVASVGYIALEGYNLYISSKLKKEGVLPATEPKPVTAMLAANNTLRAKAVNWYRKLKANHRHISNILDGVPFGFLAGFGVKKITGKNIWEHMSGNGTSELPLQPEGVANVITKDSVNNLSNLPYACEGAGLPNEKILPSQRKYWENVKFVSSTFDPTRGEPVLLFKDPTRTACVGSAPKSALEAIGFTFDEEMLAAMGEAVTKATTRC